MSEFVRKGVAGSSNRPLLRDVVSIQPEIIRPNEKLETTVKTYSLDIDRSERYWLDTNKMWLTVRFRILKGDGTPLKVLPTVDTSPACSSLPALTCFINCSVKYNDVPVWNARNCYPWYCQHVFENLMPKREKVWLAPMAGFEDRDINLIPVVADDQITGYVGTAITTFNKRVAKTIGSSELEVVAPLLFDGPHNNLLPGSIGVKIELTVGDPRLFLLSMKKDASYTFDLRDLHLEVSRVEVDRSRFPATPRRLQYVEHEIVVETIPSGLTTFKRQVASMNTPRRVVFVLLSEDAYQGRLHLAPFQYGHFNLSSVQLQLLPSTYIPPRPLEVDWASNFGVRRLYAWFHENMRHSTDDASFDTEWMEAAKNYFAFDLTVDKSAGSSHLAATTEADGVVLHLGFKEKLTQNVKVIIFREYEKEMVIERDSVSTKLSRIHQDVRS